MQYVLTDYFKTHDSITRSQVEKALQDETHDSLRSPK